LQTLAKVASVLDDVLQLVVSLQVISVLQFSLDDFECAGFYLARLKTPTSSDVQRAVCQLNGTVDVLK
jgi:hypothetical protein